MGDPEGDPMTWTAQLAADPLPWLLDPNTPAVRAATLTRLLDRAPDDPEVRAATAAAMTGTPIRQILAAQSADGWWAKPGPGYSPKYTSTVWQVIFLDQLGADPAHPGVQRACEYVLAHTQCQNGGMGCSSVKGEGVPPPSAPLHCLHGNLLGALIGFGLLEDPRVQAAVDWAVRAITGEGMERYYASRTSGPDFACGANDGRPCAWGAIKQVLGLTRIPPERRTAGVRRALAAAERLLLSRDPAVADYPMPARDTKPSSAWFKLGFPSGYVCDVLQNLEALDALGRARDPRLSPAVQWLLQQQDDQGRWVNRYAYNGRTTVVIERQGLPSKWVTLRACTVLRAALG